MNNITFFASHQSGHTSFRARSSDIECQEVVGGNHVALIGTVGLLGELPQGFFLEISKEALSLTLYRTLKCVIAKDCACICLAIRPAIPHCKSRFNYSYSSRNAELSLLFPHRILQTWPHVSKGRSPSAKPRIMQGTYFSSRNNIHGIASISKDDWGLVTMTDENTDFSPPNGRA